MPTPSEQVLRDLRERDADLAKIAAERAGAARLLTELPQRFDPLRIASDVQTHRTWELAGLYFMHSGVDGVLHKNGSRSILQCKRYQGDIGEPIVRDLFGTVHHHKAQSGILVTTGKVSGPAHTFANGKPLTLVDGRTLLRLLDAAQLTEDVVPDEFVARSTQPPTVLQPRKGRSRVCPLCGSPLVRRSGRHGQFLGCKVYPSCRYTCDTG
jgi:hypothetical protein